ncbi:transmembrane protein [Synechococcus phage S-CREM1]|nr:transmembrane protein [Synechococcus phage S-CREM1]
MTHYDMLIDTIVGYLYDSYKDGVTNQIWYADLAENKAQEILEIVEEFQQKRTKLSQWRASD